MDVIKTNTTTTCLLTFCMVVLVGLNLRPFLVAMGPLMPQVLVDTGMGLGSASLLTLVPMWLMGALTLLIACRPEVLSNDNILFFALLLLATGNGMRYAAYQGVVLLFSAFICGLAVALIQFVLPGIIKQTFRQHASLVVGCYSASLMLGGAMGASAMPALVSMGTEWTTALALLTIPAVIAGIVAKFGTARIPSVAYGKVRFLPLARRRRSWELMFSFGIVNGAYGSLVTWLPSYYLQLGWDTSASSALIVALSLCQAVVAFTLPICTKGHRDKRPWLMLVLLFLATGLIGLIAEPTWNPMVWVFACGIGLGGGFSLLMIVSLEHVADVGKANALTALMQGGGFMIAAVCPLLFTLIVQLFGTFSAGWWMHLILLACVSQIYKRFNPRNYLTSVSG